MKKRFLASIVLSALAIGATPILVNSIKEEVVVTYATQHKDNFDEYTYSGHYYDSITATGEGLNGALRQALTPHIYPDGWYSYSSSGPDTLSTILQSADEDPTNSNNMIYLYTRDSVKKNAASSWNREHVWPQSLSGGCWGKSKAGTDILHIRPTYNDTNNKRGNDIYGEVSKSSPLVYSGMEYGYNGGGKFMPLDSVKGDVARIVMYVWVAYKNHYSNLPNITNTFESYDTLLKWHMEDKPDVSEGYRNDFSETSKQKNRNPFVDHPEYAWMIFGDSASSSVKEACKKAYPGNTPKVSSITINTLPTKRNYIQYEDLDLSGIKVTATYEDSSTKDVSNSVTADITKLENVGDQVVTISYGGATATFTVTVSEYVPPVLEAIEVMKLPTKINYYQGDSLDPSGILVMAYYDNEEYDKDITDLVSYNPTELTSLGENTITVSYIEDEVTMTDSFTVNVLERPHGPVLESIEIEEYPNKLEYEINEILDPTGIVVIAHYSDSSEEDVTSYVAYSPLTFTEEGEIEVTVTYSEDEITVSDTFTVNVTEIVDDLSAITIMYEPFKTIYYVDEELNLEGMMVIAYYESGYEEDVTDLVEVNAPKFDHAGEYIITVSYTEEDITKTSTFKVTVKDKPVPTPTPTPDEPKKGCGGDINATSIVLFTISGALILISLAIIVIRKHKKVIKNK